MTVRTPFFENAPVGQVVLGVVFQPILSLRASHLGVFWSEINAEGAYPIVEEFSAEKPRIERFESNGTASSSADVKVSVAGQKPIPRVVFSSRDGSNQVAIQRDLLQVSWRRTGKADYPRYEVPRNLFLETFRAFEKFLAAGSLGRVRVRQAEISYLNVLDVNAATPATDVEQLVALQFLKVDPLPPSDHFHLLQRHTLEEEGEPWARLYINIDSEGWDGLGREGSEDAEESGARLGFTVAGPSNNAEEMMSFLDRGHDVIVSSFARSLTDYARVLWGNMEEKR